MNPSPQASAREMGIGDKDPILSLMSRSQPSTFPRRCIENPTFSFAPDRRHS